jgi:hypothetical protein
MTTAKTKVAGDMVMDEKCPAPENRERSAGV